MFLSHNFSEQTNVDVSVGAQKSQSQKIGFLNLSTPLSQTESESYYVNARMKLRNFSGQLNFNSGKDENNYKYNSYKFTNIEGDLEYFKQFKFLSIRPGFNYKYMSYNSPITYNEPLSFNKLNYQFKDEPRVTSSYSAFILTEWKPTSKLRMIGAIRVDKFDFNKNYFTNFELASTYRINKNNLIRAAFSKANKSPFFFDSYLNTSMLLKYDKVINETQTLKDIPILIKVKGQENLKYPTITNYEIGWRSKVNTKFNFDVELFYSKVENFVNPNIYHQLTRVQQLDDSGQPEYMISLSAIGDVLFENYDLNASQFGTGITLNYNFSEMFQAKIFGTYQHTSLKGKKDLSIDITSIYLEPVSSDNKLTTIVDTKMNPTQWSDEATPSFFGGFLLNYKPNKQWNFSTDGYVYSQYKFETHNYYEITDETTVDAAKLEMGIKSNIILNAKTSFKLNKNTSLNLTLKNVFGNHREFGFADQIGKQLLIGLKWELDNN